MSRSNLYSYARDSEMDFEDLEDEIARIDAASLQARFIEQQGRDIFRSVMDLDNGAPSLRTLRRQKQLLTKLSTLLSAGALARPLREPVGEEHARLIQFYNSVVQPQYFVVSSREMEAEVRRDSQPDDDDGDAESMSEDEDNAVIVMESSSDEAETRSEEDEDVYLSSDTDSDF